MKNYPSGTGLCPRVLFISFLLFFSLYSSAQRNVTTIRMKGEIIKKKAIVESLAEWMSKSDLRKADSCIQVIFNAVDKKDTSGEEKGIAVLTAVMNSRKYEGESRGGFSDCFKNCKDTGGDGCFWKCITGGLKKDVFIKKEVQ